MRFFSTKIKPNSRSRKELRLFKRLRSTRKKLRVKKTGKKENKYKDRLTS